MDTLILRPAVRNRLLRSLSFDDFSLVAPHLVLVQLPNRRVVEEQGELVEFVHFFESGIGSNIVSGPNEEQAEAGHIGWEGMSGRAVVLSGTISTGSIIMQVAGTSLHLPADDFAAMLKRSGTLRDMMNQYVVASEVQVAQTLLAATRFSVTQRLARWLLMYHDRLDGEDLPVTHEVLSLMLGVRRPGVTDAIHVIEGERGIRTHRGIIRVLDRPLLVVIAGGCYGIPEREYERLIPMALSGAWPNDEVLPQQRSPVNVI